MSRHGSGHPLLSPNIALPTLTKPAQPTFYTLSLLYFLKTLFIYWLRRVSVAIFPCGTWAPGRAGSFIVTHGLSCSAASGILVPGPGIEPASPALEGGFLTAGPPGKSYTYLASTGFEKRLQQLKPNYFSNYQIR